jgi:hypothetical protein
MIVTDAFDVPGAVRFEAKERTDVLGSLSQLGEEGTAFRLAGRLGSHGLFTLSSSEHDPSSLLPTRGATR